MRIPHVGTKTSRPAEPKIVGIESENFATMSLVVIVSGATNIFTP